MNRRRRIVPRGDGDGAEQTDGAIGPGGDLASLALVPFERAEIVVDFSGHAGETFTVTNGAEFPFTGSQDPDGGHGGHDEGSEESASRLDEIMQFRVTEPTTRSLTIVLIPRPWTDRPSQDTPSKPQRRPDT